MNAVLSISQMIELEQRAFAEGVDAWSLMKKAGRQMAQAIQLRFSEPGSCQIFVGKGNNGGDAWVVASFLSAAGWWVEVTCPFTKDERSPLAQRAAEDWALQPLKNNEKNQARPFHHRQPRIVVDGLLGIGAKGEIRQPISTMIQEINRLRNEGAVVFALDLPSGLGSETCVVADHTLTVGFVKDILLTDWATHFVGRISVLALQELSDRFSHKTQEEVATAESLRRLVPPRSFDIHKGQCGHVMLVAGSLDTVGAAALASMGALRGGAGLVSLVCPPDAYPFLASMLAPEVMARPWIQPLKLGKEKMDVLAIGPGLDPKWNTETWTWLEAAQVPFVLDAGALTIIANDLPRFKKLTGPILLTPHPGEMERIFPAEGRTRARWTMDFVSEFGNNQLTLLLKGSRTIIAQLGQPLIYNQTGHPGMATGGMGDTLTGVCAALIGQKLSTHQAACVGAWVCGRAAEIAIEAGGQSQESLLPTDLANHLGQAFVELRSGIY